MYLPKYTFKSTCRPVRSVGEASYSLFKVIQGIFSAILLFFLGINHVLAYPVLFQRQRGIYMFVCFMEIFETLRK